MRINQYQREKQPSKASSRLFFIKLSLQTTLKSQKSNPNQSFTCMWLSVFSICESLYPDASRSKQVQIYKLPVIHKFAILSHPLQTLEKESTDRKLKTFGCTSIFQKVLQPKQMLPLWQHAVRIPDSASTAPSKASSMDARQFVPTLLPRQKQS